MYNAFYSSAEHLSTPLDCRRLSLSFHYHQISKDNINRLFQDIMQSILNFCTDNFIFSWYRDHKPISKQPSDKVFQEMIYAGKRSTLSFDAYVSCPTIDSVRTLKKYQKSLETIHPVYMFGWEIDPLEEVDALGYQAYIDSILPLNRQDNQIILDKVFTIFKTPNKKPVGLHYHPDLTGSFTAVAHCNNPQLYYGSCSISISCFCLGDMLDAVAEHVSSYAMYLSETYRNLNIHVSLQPYSDIGTHYMKYFGKYPVLDNSHAAVNLTEEEWYSVYYLCGIEWLNILSPLASQHLSSASRSNNTNPEVLIKQLNSGGVLCRSSRPISSYDYQSAMAIKELIYPALYPGCSSWPLRIIFPFIGTRRGYGLCPRSNWEIVPVDKSELSIIGSDLVYTARCALEKEKMDAFWKTE